MLTDFSLIESASGRLIVERLELAAGYWSRLAGLQLRASLPPGRALLLVPCGSVHTMMMRFPIDLAFLDSTGKILGVRAHVKPWRMAMAPRGTHAVLEMPASTSRLQTGDSLALVVRNKGQQCPEFLRFLSWV